MQHTKISNIGNDIKTVLFPLVCFGCMVRLYRGEYVLCAFCRHQIPLTEYNYREENAVDRIFYGRCRIVKAASFLYYSQAGIVRNLIRFLKYRNQEVIGEFLGNWVGEELKSQPGVKDVDYVIPVPLHPRKLRKRGYNQVSRFGNCIATILGADYREDLLIKSMHTRTQTLKNRFFRLQDEQKIYRVTKPEVLRSASVLLVDDIITTGATMESCCMALNEIPGLDIYICSMAYVP